MKVDGRLLAQDILHHLKEAIKKNHLTPHLAIILVGENPASAAYAAQKQKRAHDIGAKASISQYTSTITNQELLEKIDELNNDTTVHGIIIQRPLPTHIDEEKINDAIIPEKDIDSFHKDSPFENPLVKAVLVILQYIYSSSERSESRSENNKIFSTSSNNTLHGWLKEKNIVVMGKGETGGKPIISYLKKHGIIHHVIDSTTTTPTETLKKADIVISAVGKEVITEKDIKNDAILIGVGQHKTTTGSFSGDYNDDTIASVASWYTPTPGGVGPLTVACLLENLVKASR